MTIIGLIILGAAAGFLATRLMGMDTPILPTILVGVGGAIIGGLVLRVLLAFGGMIGGLIGATIGAMALIWLWKIVSR